MNPCSDRGAAGRLRHGDEPGRLAPGQYASVIAVTGNPLKDIRVMKQVAFVRKEGAGFKQDGHAKLAMLHSDL